jgi:hypothetical protein
VVPSSCVFLLLHQRRCCGTQRKRTPGVVVRRPASNGNLVPFAAHRLRRLQKGLTDVSMRWADIGCSRSFEIPAGSSYLGHSGCTLVQKCKQDPPDPPPPKIPSSLVHSCQRGTHRWYEKGSTSARQGTQMYAKEPRSAGELPLLDPCLQHRRVSSMVALVCSERPVLVRGQQICQTWPWCL